MAGWQQQSRRARGGALSRRALLLGALLSGCSPAPAAPTATPAAPAPRPAPPRPTPAAAPAPAPALPPGARPGGRVVEGVLTLPASLNPLLADDGPARRLAALLAGGLVAVAPDTLAPAPALAERWEVSPDGLRYTFRLRPGLTFHDGQPVTARDAAATMRALAAERGLSARAATLAELLEAATAQGDLDLIIRLRQPYAPFLTELATLPVLPAAQLEPGRGGVAASPAGTTPIGAGPFALARRGGDALVLRRFPGYWGGPAPLDEVELRRLPDPDALLAALAGGALDLVELDPGWFTPARQERLRAAGDVALSPYRSLAVEFLVFQLSAARGTPLADPRVRRGLAHLIDRPALAAATTLGLGELPAGTLPPASWAAVPGVEPAYPFDPARAAALLDLAGWPRGDDGLRRRDGRPLAVTLVINGGNQLRAALQAGIAAAWQAAGVTVALAAEPFDAFVERVAGRGDFEAALLGFDLGPDPDQGLLWQSRAGRAGYNVNRYSNAQVDRLLAAARATLDRDQRRQLTEEIQRAVLTDLPALPLVCPPGLVASRTRLHNLAPSPVDATHGAARWWVA
jgi:peptide/nickel transport system substrate-binding protein